MTTSLGLTVYAVFILYSCASAGIQLRNLQSLYSKQNVAVFKTVRVVSEVKPVNEQYPSAVLFDSLCGGTIISSTWILTAARCLRYTSGFDILAGTNNTENDTGLRRQVKRLVIHPRFSMGPWNAERYGNKQVSSRWDFLLAELEIPLPLDGKTMVAAALQEDARLTPGLEVGYAGYGGENYEEYMRPQMHDMDLEIQPDSECSKLVEYDMQDMLCARGGPPRFDSACNGDSGSGLMRNGTIIGIVSWVEDDAILCRNGAKVYFSRVSSARDWIRQVTKI